MDAQLRPVTTEAPTLPGAMPPRAPLSMPVQDLKQPVQHPPLRENSAWTWFARLIMIVGPLAITGYGLREMLHIVGFDQMTVLQGVMILFFTLTLGWIAFAAASAIAGLLTRQLRFAETERPQGLTALVMPIYHESPVHTTAALQAMAEELRELGGAERFEIVVLSDTRDADSWIRESLAVHRLRTALKDNMPVWYRRRVHNTARKAGNVEDFVKQWGGRYAYMIVLDADSLMDAPTLSALVRRMEADERLGILQTVPLLVGGTSLFGRLQQFASRVYGNAIASGVASWSGTEGNYWGHNAIIRVQAFAQACGLPHLKGRKPFGGHVLSHDFVEAALIRRAGWKVCMASDLKGSWEGSPPMLTDVAVRDRRWAQGNLQHSKVIGARGLAATSRLHFAIGIMSYLSSPLWLLLLCIGFALTLQANLVRPEYFPQDFQLFPTWPKFDSQRMVWLFMFSMGVLLLPKAIGLLCTLANNAVRRGCGGFIRLTIGVPLEIVLSALYAPISMLFQSHHVFDILTGRDSGWGPQRRNANAMTWREAWDYHHVHTWFGLAMGLIAHLLSPTLFLWLLPATAGLVFSIPLSKLSGSVSVARVLERAGLLATPEETQAPRILARREELEHAAPVYEADMLEHLVRDRGALAAHLECNLPRPADPRGQPDPHRLLAEQMIADAHSLPEALLWLGRAERVQVASDSRLLDRLVVLADRDDSNKARRSS